MEESMEQERSTEVQKWADEAMFRAEPVDAATGPQVYLLWMTPDPLGAIAATCKMYKGEVCRSLDHITDAERLHYFDEVQATRLKAPFEFVQFHFLIEGVTRAFTHQLVRQRTATYAQESLRFAVKEDFPIGLPPSLWGTTGDQHAAQHLETNEWQRLVWEETVDAMQAGYEQLVNSGMPAEDARGLLPTNILTRVHYTTDLRALQEHAGNRLCTQAQFEWRLVWSKIIAAIREIDYPGDLKPNGQTRVYMADKLCDLFKPVCYLSGRCEFKSKMDRPCSIRDRVDANEKMGRPSREWGNPAQLGNVLPIEPREWLLDPNAAR